MFGSTHIALASAPALDLSTLSPVFPVSPRFSRTEDAAEEVASQIEGTVRHGAASVPFVSFSDSDGNGFCLFLEDGFVGPAVVLGMVFSRGSRTLPASVGVCDFSSPPICLVEVILRRERIVVLLRLQLFVLEVARAGNVHQLLSGDRSLCLE